ncbi:CD1375 family protein [Clostridium luticellarii]|nr:CD1375 family protein [Clostridium luticellarii]
MVDLYVCLIVNNRRSFAQVPTKFQDAVRTDLTAIGLDENGNPVQTTQ